jgi:hypothetical protein
VSVINKLAYGIKHIVGMDVAGHNLVAYPDDTFIVSYPKSGNTWTRFLIANLLQLDPPVTLLDMERLVPAVDGQTRGFFKRMPRPRVIRDHGPFNPEYKNVIYIVRDPRDVVISAYNFSLKGAIIDESYPLATFTNEFVRGVRSEFGSWGENVASWLATRGNSPRFLLLRYEDMLAETALELARIASFLGMQVSTDQLAEAVKQSSADNMRKLEKMHGDKWVQNKNMKRKDIPFVRTAKAGGWQSILPKAAVAEMESAWGTLMSRLGYELSAPEAVETGAVNAAVSRD